MKNHIHILLAVIILGFGVVSSHAGTDADKDLAKKLSDILAVSQKIQPGMTRAALTNDFFAYNGGVLFGPLGPRDFQEHYTFSFRGCDLIKIDVTFVRSTSKEAQLTDSIAKISKPYLAWSVAD